MCARGMDAGINGDFEYLINESSPASKSAFEPSSLFFARVSLPLSLSLFLYFILILPLYPCSSFFFFAPVSSRERIFVGGYLRSGIFGCAFRFVRICDAFDEIL